MNLVYDVLDLLQGLAFAPAIYRSERSKGTSRLKSMWRAVRP